MDAYNIAFRIPNLVRDLFAEGAMSAAFVPTFTRTLANEGRARAWRLGSLVVNALLPASGAIVVAGMVFAWPITTLPDFSGAFAVVPGKLQLHIGSIGGVSARLPLASQRGPLCRTPGAPPSPDTAPGAACGRQHE
jgi:hypothetical protein